MILKIDNFAKVNKAEIEINSITVIAGLNNTAKTTIGKILYCIIKSFDGIENKINAERKNRLRIILDKALEVKTIDSHSRSLDVFSFVFDNPLDNLVKKITEIENLSNYNQDILADKVNALISDEKRIYFNNKSTKGIYQLTKEIIDLYTIRDEDLEKVILTKNLNCEFNNQISNVNRKKEITKIELFDEKSLNVLIKDNRVIAVSDDLKVDNTAIMIDNPFIMDHGYRFDDAENHNGDLYSMLGRSIDDLISDAFDEVITNKKLESILEKLSTVIPGDLKLSSSGEDVYEEASFSEPIFISNLSTGLKTFVIIKKLLQNNMLTDKSVLILDEPEIHLHPEWQLVYAELIVLLQKEFNIQVLITTHSPYFLNAIEVFTHTHSVEDVHYYLADTVDSYIEFREVSNSLEEIYSLLAKPFQTLENMRYGGA